MRRLYVPTTNAEDWRKLLVRPDLHWKDGYSAKTIAERWESYPGNFPPEVTNALNASGIGPLSHLSLLAAFPEYKVALPGGNRPSQTDVMAIARTVGKELAVLAVEGKVNESFGPLVGDWQRDASPGKEIRLASLLDRLGLAGLTVTENRYQLLHRAVSALLTADEWTAHHAVMLIHAFSEDTAEPISFSDYAAFAQLLGVAKPIRDNVQYACNSNGVYLYLGWITGQTMP